MMDANISIDSEAVRGFVSQAIIQSITAEQRELVLRQAVESLLDEPKDSYGRVRAPSPLAAAFTNAVQQVSTSVVREYLDDETIKQNVRQQIITQIEKMLAEKDWLYDSIGMAVGDRVREIIQGADS